MGYITENKVTVAVGAATFLSLVLALSLAPGLTLTALVGIVFTVVAALALRHIVSRISHRLLHGR